MSPEKPDCTHSPAAGMGAIEEARRMVTPPEFTDWWSRSKKPHATRMVPLDLVNYGCGHSQPGRGSGQAG